MNTETVNNSHEKVAVIGLGYVGLPLLCNFARRHKCYGLDINSKRIDELSRFIDSKNCVDVTLLDNLKNVQLTTDWNELSSCNYVIIAAPTPIDDNNKPDLRMLKDICHHVGLVMSKGCTIVFESTVAPGTTEEICVPILEKESNMRLNKDFKVGYSPERINVGDSEHTLSTVPKIVAGSDRDTLSRLSSLYCSGLNCTIIPASSIKVAEATKLYENVQRDVLIALANQYSQYCRAEGININEVTKCSSTKWNFVEIYPGLVGGHCIGVDPYYLIERAKSKNSSMSLVELSREINEGISEKIANHILSLCIKYQSLGICILGASYKPNVGDTRNSKAIDIINSLTEHGLYVEVYDPLCNKKNLQTLCSDANVLDSLSECHNNIVAILVNHNIFSDFVIPNVKYIISLSELL